MDLLKESSMSISVQKTQLQDHVKLPEYKKEKKLNENITVKNKAASIIN
jgi:hypothetical protein